jgi:hypothetical protein
VEPSTSPERLSISLLLSCPNVYVTVIDAHLWQALSSCASYCYRFVGLNSGTAKRDIETGVSLESTPSPTPSPVPVNLKFKYGEDPGWFDTITGKRVENDEVNRRLTPLNLSFEYSNLYREGKLVPWKLGVAYISSC